MENIEPRFSEYNIGGDTPMRKSRTIKPFPLYLAHLASGLLDRPWPSRINEKYLPH